ncbi:MAG: AAA family ATPase [Candidatus Aminicenantes bacterium]|nr:AAA family ATPase [Candidatus Aminicenantes bacterium]
MKSGPASRSFEGLNISAEFHPFLTHLSDLARARDRMPFIGRDNEIEAVMETLLRKLKKGVILVGKPGVGKTALITELAARINRGKVPDYLKGKIILELALNSFLYSRRSSDLLAKDFEKLFCQIKANRERVILFLDELQLQSVVGAAKPGKGNHLQELLKAHITSRDLPIIAAATPEDYYLYFKSDELIAANFSAIQLNEPEKSEMLEILAGVKAYFERYYGLRIPVRLFESIYTLAQRFIPARAFPDKAIELLDISCSKASLKKVKTLGIHFVYQSIAGISKLPIGIVQLDPQVHYRCLLDYLKAASVDQASALEEIARIIKLAKLETAVNGTRPQGIFLFLGPAGIGKSFVAARIAEYLFGSVEKLRRIDLAGFKKAEDMEKLIGGPDMESSGLLIQEIENHPFSVLLLENIDEAHPALLYFLGKALSKGELIDHLGKRHYLANIIVILSLSAIGEEKKDSTIGFVSGEPGSGSMIIAPKIMNVLDWVDEIIQFAPLQREHLQQIARIRLDEMTAELRERHGCRFTLEPELLDAIVAAAEASGRYAHAVGEFVERDIRLPVMDMITRTDKKLHLRIAIENKRVKIASV